jgi:hypothetical protein
VKLVSKIGFKRQQRPEKSRCRQLPTKTDNYFSETIIS